MSEYVEILFYASEIILVLSYSATRMVVLRFMACFADIGFVIAALAIGLDGPGMKPTLIFAGISFIINAVHIYRILHMKIPITLPTHYEAIYHSKFSSLKPREFLHLLDIAKIVAHDHAEIIQEGKHCDVFLCLDGKLSVNVGGKNVAILPAGSIVGEVSSLTGSRSLASVSTIDRVNLCQWTRQSCEKLKQKHPEIYLKFHGILLGEMRGKLESQNLAMAN